MFSKWILRLIKKEREEAGGKCENLCLCEADLFLFQYELLIIMIDDSKFFKKN